MTMTMVGALLIAYGATTRIAAAERIVILVT
jgi:hypothetical protein